MPLLIAAGILFFTVLTALPAGAATTFLFVKETPVGSENCSGWDNACDLQGALALAQSSCTALTPCEIWVKEGTYYPTADANRGVSFQLINDVKIYGGFAGDEADLSQRDPGSHLTVLSGDIGTSDDATDNSYHVVDGSGTNDTAVLDGFMITGGNADSGATFVLGGGGMYVNDGSPTINNVTFTANSAYSYGGAIYNTGGSPILTNVTIGGNIADDGSDSGLGGGIYNDSGNPLLINATISGNTASNTGGGIYNASGTVTLANSIISGNTGGNCNAAIDDGGYNIDDGTTCGFDDLLTGSMSGADPLLDPDGLQDNGGPSPTIALQGGSPAIDAIPDEACTDSNGLALAFDQRGVARPKDGDGDTFAHCDIGAYEVDRETTTSLNSSLNPSEYGDSVTFTAAIAVTEPWVLGGTVAFKADDAPITGCEAVAVSNGSAECTVSTLQADSHDIIAEYSGDGFFLSNTSSVLTQQVDKADPDVTTWPTASPILYGQTLEDSTLSGGSASPAGSFAFTDPDTQPDAGTAPKSVTFTPEDTDNYNTITGEVNVEVNKADPDVTTWPTASPILYGQTLEGSTLSGGAASPAGSFTFTDPGTQPDVGTAPQSVTFTPEDTDNYNTITGQVSVKVSDRLYVKPAPDGISDGICDGWDNACDLQYALGLAASGLEIWVKEGIYYPTADSDRTVSFELKDGVGIHGGFAGNEDALSGRVPGEHPTILSGDIGTPGDATDNSYHVVTADSSTGASAVLDGFAITAGNANGPSPYDAGGGIYNGGGSPTISNVTFSGNSAFTTGGGIYNDGGSPTISNATFSGNSAFYGGGMYDANGGSPGLTNVTFSGNSAGRGAGVYNDAGTLTLTNTTVSGNSASNYGGGIYNASGTVTVKNSIIAENTGGNCAGTVTDNGYNIDDGTTCAFSGSSMSSTPPELGTLGNYGGYTETIPLLSDSLAIDAIPDGTSDCDTAIVADQRSVARPQPVDGACDIGAFEARSFTLTVFGDGGESGTITNGGEIDASWNGTAMSGTASEELIEQTGPYTITASPATGSHVTWSGGCSSISGEENTDCTIDSMNSDKTVTATFEINQYTVTATAGAHGTVGGSSSSQQTVPHGSPVSFTFDAATGYHVWTITDTCNGPGYTNTLNGGVQVTYHIDSITSGCTVAATFALNHIVFAPVVTGPAKTADTTPLWSWTAGGGGNGNFEYQLDSEAGAWTETTATAYTPDSPLAEGLHTLYVRERDDDGNWSASGFFAINVYTTIYAAPDGRTSEPCDSWGSACKLQFALGISSPDEMIWAKKGTYTPGTLRSDSFRLKSDVGVYGGFAGTDGETFADRDPAANLTVLSGDIGIASDASDNSYHVVDGSDADSTAVLDGFTITAGNANGSTSPDNVGGGMFNNGGSPAISTVIFSGNTARTAGGGMYNDSGSGPSIQNTTFSDNHADFYGGAMYNHGGRTELTGVTFSGNHADVFGGAIYNDNSDLTATDVTFSDNTATTAGGGIFNNTSSPSMVDATFSSNHADVFGGGMYNTNSSPALTNVTFDGNSADGSGGGMYDTNDSSPLLIKVTFSENSAASSGGGIYNQGGNPELTNVTLSGNHADLFGGGIYNDSPATSDIAILNVTFSGNSAGDGSGVGGGGIYNSAGGGTVTLRNSIIAGSTSGGNCAGAIIDAGLNIDGGITNTCGISFINADPLLDPDGLQDNGGLTKTIALLPGSPAIDAGDDGSCPPDDQRGITRPKDGDGDTFAHCDIGAYEVDRETATSLSSSLNPSAYGDSVTFTATVTDDEPWVPSGTVAFKDGGVDIPSCEAKPVSGGSASCTVASLTGGNHTITAEYSGDANFDTSASAPLTQTVNTAPTATVVVSSLTPSLVGQEVTFTATVTSGAGTPGGTVEFKDESSDIAGCTSVTVVAGTAACQVSSLTAGEHTITATYSGDTSFSTSTSPGVGQTVHDIFTLATNVQGALTVTADPVGQETDGINCQDGSSGDCSESYEEGTQVTLTAEINSPDACYYVAWTGDCTGNSGTCTLTMDAGREVTATYESHEVKNMRGPGYFKKLQNAYAGALNGDTLRAREITFTEDLVFDSPVAVTLEGGYGNCDYSVADGQTTIQGSLTVTDGSVTLENIVITE